MLTFKAGDDYTRFNNKLGILEVSYSGVILANDLIEYGEWLSRNPNLPRKLRILTDATQAIYNISQFDIERVRLAMVDHCKPYIFVKNVLIHRKPVETAYSVLVSKKNQVENYIQAVFYTREAALEWLLG
ncbi:MAG: hypothetical protein PWR03_1508 [Tenuifilum sp.]|uniref:hypothetical protein n=1 Tax=Tenuifilum sp. TaxID=2760880 RepID=UPI0024AA4D0C|nr:hypothetical protein [Tenuifilum sp.]MDI3527325.1 hypothetical protein [Tenuifilum sp.]